jgi:4-hydroxythreonine-4-phosphate dehydrogenase
VTAPLALTMGDPAGIGPEIAALAWRARGPETAPFLFVGDVARLRAALARAGIDAPLAPARYADAATLFPDALPVLADFPDDPSEAAATVAAIERAVEAVRAGAARAVVTNPISKERLHAAGFRHPGHTEFLGELALRHWGAARAPVMMLWSPTLAAVPVTIHIALEKVKTALTPDLLRETILTVDADMRSRFGLARPRIAVAGLNPHAGEGGAMGREEIEIISPVLEELRARGLDLAGPLPADTMFHPRARARYDAAVCMYHDQALIPLKTLAFDEGVNVTLGLPFVRTSPDHGTAFDIAGQGIARPDSLIAALALADRLSK